MLHNTVISTLQIQLNDITANLALEAQILNIFSCSLGLEPATLAYIISKTTSH